MTKEEFLPFLESIISTYDKVKLVDLILLIANECGEEEQEKIHKIILGKEDYTGLSEMKKIYNRNEISELMDEISKLFFNLKNIQKGKYFISKYINEEWDDRYDDINDEFIHEDLCNVVSLLIDSLKVIKKGVKLGLNKELYEFVHFLINLEIQEICEDLNEKNKISITELFYYFDVKVFNSYIGDIFYVLYSALSLTDAGKEIFSFTKKEDIAPSIFSEFLINNNYKINDVDGMIFSYVTSFSDYYHLQKMKNQTFFIKEIFDLFDLAHDKQKLKEFLLSVVNLQEVFLVYLVKYYKFEDIYLELFVEYLKKGNCDFELVELLINLFSSKFDLVKNNSLINDFVNLSFDVCPSILTYKNIVKYSKDNVAQTIYNKSIHLINSEEKYSYFERNGNLLGYLFLLLINKDEFFKNIMTKNINEVLDQEFIEILTNLVAKEENESAVIEQYRNLIFVGNLLGNNLRILTDLIDLNNGPMNNMNYLIQEINFNNSEKKIVYEIISVYTKAYTKNVTRDKDRKYYYEAARLINLVDNLNVYINKTEPGLIIKDYLNEFKSFRALKQEINSPAFKKKSWSKPSKEFQDDFDYNDDELPF